MPTILDVAKAAGVSVATVSRVMNQTGTVAEETAMAVRKAIEQLAYVPNQQARNLRRNESRTVLVLLPNITNPYYANVFSGINEKAQTLGYSLYLCSTEGGDSESLLSSAIDGRTADGAILLAIDHDEAWLQKYSDIFPIVQCCEFSERCNTTHVSIDNYRAGYEATEYLLKVGCRNICIVSSTNKFMSTVLRMKGYRDALEKAGITPNERSIAYADSSYSYQSSLAAARSLLTRKDRPDGLFCIGDSIALSAVVVAGELGISVPDEVSIVGFDDVIYTQMIHPYLSTMIQPCASLGMKAMEMIHALISGHELENRSVTLPHGFIARESTLPAP